MGFGWSNTAACLWGMGEAIGRRRGAFGLVLGDGSERPGLLAGFGVATVVRWR